MNCSRSKKIASKNAEKRHPTLNLEFGSAISTPYSLNPSLQFNKKAHRKHPSYICFINNLIQFKND